MYMFMPHEKTLSLSLVLIFVMGLFGVRVW